MGDSNRSNQQAAKKGPVFRIPSAAEVAASLRPTAPTILFRPSSASTPPPRPPPEILNPSHQRPPFPVRPNSPRPFPVRTPPAQTSSFAEAFSFARDGVNGVQSEQASPPLTTTRSHAPGLGSTPSIPGRPPGPVFQGGNASGLKPTYAARPVQQAANKNAIVASFRQRGNPILKHIRNVRWVHGDIVPDYLMGETTCALYLSVRYHLLHPDYIYFRIRELQKNYRLRVVLCHVDVEDVIKPLHEVTKIALLHDCTLICAWSNEECARYLETIKMYENKPADNIQERTDHDYLSRLTAALTTVRHVNKTDTVTLGTTFGSLANLMGASMEELAKCPGIGEKKVKRLYDAFHEPFRRVKPTRLDAPLDASASTSLEARAVAAVGAESASAVKAAARGPVVASIRATRALPESGDPDEVVNGDEAELVDRYEDDDEIEDEIETDLAEFLEAPVSKPKRQKLASRKREASNSGAKQKEKRSLQEEDSPAGVLANEGEKVGSAYQNEIEVI